MTNLSRIVPRQAVPDFAVSLIGGGTWRLSKQVSENFTLAVFCRGYHCPICRAYLNDLKRNQKVFAALGVQPIVISSDGEDRAQRTFDEWRLDGLTVGYDLALSDAQQLGLYISSGIGKTSVDIEEPARFSEPGVFIIRADGTLYYSSVQTMPFARPDFNQLLKAVEYAVTKNYPARGEVTDL